MHCPVVRQRRTGCKQAQQGQLCSLSVGDGEVLCKHLRNQALREMHLA